MFGIKFDMQAPLPVTPWKDLTEQQKQERRLAVYPQVLDEETGVIWYHAALMKKDAKILELEKQIQQLQTK